MFSLSDYDYHLPKNLIAQTVAHPPQSCKFLIYDKKTQSITDAIFSDITKFIDPNTLMIFNNTKVLKARLVFGGLEIFYLDSLNDYTFNALIRPGRKFKIGQKIKFNDKISFHVDAITSEGRQLTCSHPIAPVLEQYGQMPLPPYISYDKSKEDDYQPIFASKQGSVAAPTASLHFTKKLISQLQTQGVQTLYTTLHVGLGTFKQVDTSDIKNYAIHAESIEIDTALFSRIAEQKEEKKPILAVGTTVTRTLESLPYLWKIWRASNSHVSQDTSTSQASISGDLPLSVQDTSTIQDAPTSQTPISGKQSLQTQDIPSSTQTFRDTLTHDISLADAKKVVHNIQHEPKNNQILFTSKLFLYPGKPFFIIDELITNFHLPKSSLLMLVAGFMGYEQMKQLYKHAINTQYRFYSFGDAMWIK